VLIKQNVLNAELSAIFYPKTVANAL